MSTARNAVMKQPMSGGNGETATNSTGKQRVVSSLSQAIRAMDRGTSIDSKVRSPECTQPANGESGNAQGPIGGEERLDRNPIAVSIESSLEAVDDQSSHALSLGELMMMQEIGVEEEEESVVLRDTISTGVTKRDFNGELKGGMVDHHFDHLLVAMQEVSRSCESSSVDKMERDVMLQTRKALQSVYYLRQETDRGSCVMMNHDLRGPGTAINHNREAIARVVHCLKASGYDAAVCMSSWNDIVGSVPAGNYEYIDIVCESTQNRLIVDINFKSNFEIARASKHYTALLEMVPHIFIGRPERLHLMLKIMCKAAKLSLKLMGMYLPPWRKYSYLQAKWFSPHLRVTSPQKIDLPPPSPSSVVPNFPGTEDDELDELKLRVKQSFSSAIASKKHMTTMYITDWKLPAASPCRLTSSRKRVSALANALKERNQATSSRDKSACLAIKWNSAAMAC